MTPEKLDMLIAEWKVAFSRAAWIASIWAKLTSAEANQLLDAIEAEEREEAGDLTW